MKNKRRIYKIINSFFIFVLMFIANLFIPISGNIYPAERMWLVFNLCVVAISVFLLVKYKLPTKAQIILSFCLGLLMFAAYRGISFSSVKAFISTTLCAMASFSTFCKYPVYAVLSLKNKQIKNVLISILVGLLVGSALGTVNLYFSGQPLHFKFDLSCVLTALSPAILDEVCYRLVLFAYCLSLLDGEIRSKVENFWCYFMMIVPHALIHTPYTIFSDGVMSGVMSIIIFILIFGLPFVILQRKRDLSSAMIAHGTMEIIRFSFLRLPL